MEGKRTLCPSGREQNLANVIAVTESHEFGHEVSRS